MIYKGFTIKKIGKTYHATDGIYFFAADSLDEIRNRIDMPLLIRK